MTFEEKQQLALKFLSILGKPDADVVRELAVQDVIIWTFPGSNPHSARGTALHYLSPRFRALALFSRRHHSAWLDRRARRLKNLHNNGNSFRFALAIRQRALGLTKQHKFISPNDDRKRRSSGNKQSQ
jgi:hypothetical protein